jgi:hypothetical protein
MIKRAAFIFFVVSIYMSPVQSQQKVRTGDPILFRGVVIGTQSQERLSGSQIFINRSISSLSREDGTFSFFAYRKDTILFTSLGYRPTSLIVSDTLKASEFLTGVYLQTDTIAIGEVVIMPRLSSLKADMMNPRISPNPKIDNAQNNVSIASYQGRTGQGKMGDPAINYQVMREKQKIAAYERGGIPSDRIIGLSPLLLIPAAYMLIKGIPRAPEPPEPKITSKELEELNRRYKELAGNRK